VSGVQVPAPLPGSRKPVMRSPVFLFCDTFLSAEKEFHPVYRIVSSFSTVLCFLAEVEIVLIVSKHMAALQG
jgi:hypothetical protein